MSIPTGSDAAAIAEVLEIERERCRRVSASDWEGLRQILGEDFSYTHATGKTDDKAGWIANLSKSPRTYVRDHLEARIYGDGDVAVVTGGMTNTGTSKIDGSPTKSVLVVLQVWVKRDGQWQLVANQGTRASGEH